MKIKKECSIFIDQISLAGFYGISGLEAMSYGIPTIAHVSEQAIKQSSGILTRDNLPCINSPYTRSGLKYVLEKLLKSDLQKVSEEQYTKFLAVHSESVVAHQWRVLYNTVLLKNNLQKVQ